MVNLGGIQSSKRQRDGKQEPSLSRLRHQVLHASRINAMGTMAMTVAHELNQPLAAAANYPGAAQMLITKGGDPWPVLKSAGLELLRAGDVIRRNPRAAAMRVWLLLGR